MAETEPRMSDENLIECLERNKFPEIIPASERNEFDRMISSRGAERKGFIIGISTTEGDLIFALYKLGPFVQNGRQFNVKIDSVSFVNFKGHSSDALNDVLPDYPIWLTDLGRWV